MPVIIFLPSMNTLTTSLPGPFLKLIANRIECAFVRLSVAMSVSLKVATVPTGPLSVTSSKKT